MSNSNWRRAALWLRPVMWVWLCLWLPAAALYAQTAGDDIEIRAPYLSRGEQQYELHTQLRFELPQQVEQMVREGATLNFVLQLRVSRERRWWRDAVQAEVEQRYQLQYHGVSERYVLRRLGAGAQSSHASFAEALESLKNFDGLPVLDQSLVSSAAGNEISLHARIDVRTIPRALGVVLFWVDDFSLESDWYTWPLKP